MTTPTTTTTGGTRPRSSVSPLQRIAACMLLEPPNNIQSAKALGVHSNLLSGFRALRRAHPQILDALLTWPDQRQAEGMILTYGNYGGSLRKHARTSKWQLANRLSPEVFIRLHLSSSKVLAPTLCALPDLMLEQAATMNGDLRAAFICTGRNDYHAKASVFFPGIDPSLDPRIIEQHLEHHVDLLLELAACAPGSQHGFFERWVNDSPDAAREWASTPMWKRQLLHQCTATFSITTNPKPCTVDPEAHQIWESFKYLRSQLMGTTPLPNIPHRRESEHPQAIGMFFQHFARFTFEDRPRWHEVFWNFGFMLAHGKDVGDMWIPPWGNPSF